MSKIEWVTKIGAFLFGVIYLVFFAGNETLAFAFFSIVMLTVGISHGAIDHLLLNPSIKGKDLLIFISKYLIIMAVYLIVWIFFPLVGLIAFIAMSAYHFGQSHFLDTKEGSYVKITYFLTGLFYLLLILWADFDSTSTIVGAVYAIDNYDNQLLFLIMVLGFLSLASGFISYKKKFVKKLPEFVALALLLSQPPLFMSFALYFGFWHSLPSMVVEFQALKGGFGRNQIQKFIRELLPFTLIAITGMALLIILLAGRLTSEELILVFFILISLVSAPHIWYMDKFLMQNNQN